MSSNQKQVLKLLNEASEFGLGNEPGLQDFITDYFISTDSIDSDNEHDDEEVEMELDYDDNDMNGGDDIEPVVSDNKVDDAMNVAREVYNVGDYDLRMCPCKCKQNCKEQFPPEERAKIR